MIKREGEREVSGTGRRRGRKRAGVRDRETETDRHTDRQMEISIGRFTLNGFISEVKLKISLMKAVRASFQYFLPCKTGERWCEL